MVFALAQSGCVSAVPRFSPDIQTAINRDGMRRMETDELVVYYPEGTRTQALLIASRLEYCRRELQRFELVKGGFAADKSLVVLPRLPFNNAYVEPAFAGREQVVVLPQYNTVNDFLPYGLPPDPGNIGCHEMVHDQSFRQVRGLAGFLRSVFGEIYSPQLGLDAWWQEGLAVYYETKLQGVGRLWTPYFDGLLASGMQAVPALHGGYLSPQMRRVAGGGQYLMGSHFVDYLARTYGEERLWRVILGQSNALFFPLAESREFSLVYGRSLATLIEEFEADTRHRYPPRQRPPEQRSIERLGRAASIAGARNGVEVFVTEDLDEPPRLVARTAQGKTLSSHRLTDIGIGRRLIAPDVGSISGLSLTADAAHAYFVALDQGPIFSESRLMHLDVLADELTVVDPDLGGAGGSISSDGAYYYFTRPIGEAFNLGYALFRLDVVKGGIRQLTTPAPRHYQANPVVSPDGRRLLVTEASDAGIRLALYDAGNGQRLADVAAPEGHAFQGSWVDDDHVVYSGSDTQRMQIFESDLHTDQYRRLTDAPYLAVMPFSNGETLRFLNRDGWNWTLDQMPHPNTAAWQPVRPEAAAGAKAAAPVPVDAPSERNHTPTPTALAPAPTPVPAQEVAAMRTAAEPGSTTFAFSQRRPIDDQSPNVLSDEPYSGFDGLFRPQAWFPWFSAGDDGGVAVGLSATGGDRLGRQRWGIGAAWDFRSQLPSATLSYLNTMLAPLFLRLDAAYAGVREEILDDFQTSPEGPVTIRETVGSLLLGARWYDSYELALGGRYAAARYELESSGELFEQLRFAGPVLALGFESEEQTPYAGRRLALGIDGSGTYFPEALSTVPYDLVDVRGRAGLVLPLPISKRHTLTLVGRVRALLGAPLGENLLRVGGSDSDVVPVLPDGSPTDEGGAGLLPPGLSFAENLRGFEDLTLFARRTLIGDATYTYPFIIDWGSASTLRFLPALFLSQINLDLFFSTASPLETGAELAMATGVSLELQFSLWNIPFSLEVQQARRLSQDEAFATHVAFGVVVP